jgi:hypothetical protein
VAPVDRADLDRAGPTSLRHCSLRYLKPALL